MNIPKIKLFVYLILTISYWGWYCIVTIPKNIWLHCVSKQQFTSFELYSLQSPNSNESEI